LVAVDVGATKTAATLMHADGEVTRRWHRPTREVLDSASTPDSAIGQLVRDLCREGDLGLEGVHSVVVGIPGILDRRRGVVASCPNLPELDGTALAMQLSEQLHLSVQVENDVNIIALGEHWSGRARGIDEVACVMVGSGIGCGLVLGGDLYVGTDGTAGELGHTVVELNGRECTCGGCGCLEMYCSGKALARWATTAGLQTANPHPQRGEFHGAESVISAAKAGHQAARAALEDASTYLGVGIANLVNLLNPRLVLLGGGLMVGWPLAIERVREVVYARSRPVAREGVEIDTPTLGDDAFAFGSARLVATKSLQERND